MNVVGLLLLSMLSIAGACGSTETARSRASAAVAESSLARLAELFPRPQEGIHVPVEKKSTFTCMNLVGELERVTGAHFMVAADTRSLLERGSVGLLQPLEIPPDRVWTIVEALLVDNEFVFGLVRDQDPVVFSIESFQQQIRGAGSPKRNAITIPVEALPAWRAHPAIIVTTTIELESLNVRDLSNSMRQMFSDPNSQQIIPLGNTNSLILTGFASRVADLADLLSACNARARAQIEREESLSTEQKQKRRARQGVSGP